VNGEHPESVLAVGQHGRLSHVPEGP